MLYRCKRLYCHIFIGLTLIVVLGYGAFAGLSRHDRYQAQSYLSARYAIEHDQFSEAVTFFASLDPSHITDIAVLEEAIQALIIAKRMDEAVLVLERYVALRPDAMDKKLWLVVIALGRGDNVAAARHFSDVSPDLDLGVGMHIYPFLHAWMALDAEEPLDVSAVAHLRDSDINISRFFTAQPALYYHLLGQKEASLKALDQAVAKPPLRYAVARVAASLYAHYGQKDKALALYKRYRENYALLGYFDEGTKQLEQSKDIDLLVVDKQDALVELLMEMVRLHYDYRLDRKALIYLHLVDWLDPKNDEVQFLLASGDKSRKHYVEAIAGYQNITAQSDFYYLSRLFMAESFFHDGDHKKAAKLFRKLNGQYAERYQPFLIWADLLRYEKKYRKAASLYDDVIAQLEPLDKKHSSVIFARGICYEQMGKWKKAEADLLRALRLSPHDPDILNYLGYSWIDRDKHIVQAKAMIGLAVVARPQDVHIIDSMGWALYKIGEVKQAVAFLEAAVTLEPYEAVINDHLGDAYWQQKRFNEARFQWRRVLKYPDEHVDIKGVQAKLRHGLKAVD